MKQITVKDYISLSDDKKLPYVALLISVKAKDWFKVDINNLTYNQVRNLFKKLSKSESEEDIKEIFILAFGIDEEKFYSLPIQKYFQLKKYISDYFVFLQDKEQKLLQSVSADAGIWPVTPNTPMAIAKSRPAPCLRTSAGDRLMVTLPFGHFRS